jgi:predicted Zn-dependent protease
MWEEVGSMSNLYEVADKALKLALSKGSKQTWVVAKDTSIGVARFKNKSIHQNIDNWRPIGYNDVTLLMKVINNEGRLGVSSSTTLNDVEESVADAIGAAKYGPVVSSFPEPKKAVPLTGLWYDHTALLTPEERSECVNTIVDEAKCQDERINFVGGMVSNVASSTVIANSLGLEVEHSYTGGHVIITVVAKDGLREGSGYARLSDREFHKMKVAKAAEKAALEAISTLGYQNNPVNVGRHKVIFKAEAAAEYIGTIIQEAFSVNRQPMVTARVPLGEQVFSEELTVYDNGRDLRTLMASAVDGEGTPKKMLSLINGGVPENRCYDHALAKGEDKETTGHANHYWGGFFWTGTGSGQTYLPTNQIVDPGNASLDELIEDTRDGVLVNRLRCPGSHGHTIIPDTIRADTQECWLIKNGEVVGPANYIRFTDSLVKTLKDIIVGDDSTVERVGSFVIPAIKLNSLYISQPSIVMIQ